MSLTGLFGIFFYQLFFCLATERLPAQEAFIINYLWPIMTVVFACILLKEKVTKAKVLGLVLSFAGVIIVLTKFNLSSIAGLNIGSAGFALLAAVCYGLFAGQKISLRRALQHDRSPYCFNNHKRHMAFTER